MNFVFVGYEPNRVRESRFLAGLPRLYRPQVRYHRFYGLPSGLGIRYSYDYDVTYADAAYEDQLFGTLSRLARPGDRIGDPYACTGTIAIVCSELGLRYTGTEADEKTYRVARGRIFRAIRPPWDGTASRRETLNRRSPG